MPSGGSSDRWRCTSSAAASRSTDGRWDSAARPPPTPPAGAGVPHRKAEDGGHHRHENPWGVQFRQGLFNMTSDSHLFHTREQLEADGGQSTGNDFRKDGTEYLPLYEAKLIHHFDHRWAWMIDIIDAPCYPCGTVRNAPYNVNGTRSMPVLSVALGGFGHRGAITPRQRRFRVCRRTDRGYRRPLAHAWLRAAAAGGPAFPLGSDAGQFLRSASTCRLQSEIGDTRQGRPALSLGNPVVEDV